jgi:hypothetical protein
VTKAFKLSFTHLRLSPTEAYPHRQTLGYPLLPVELRHGRHHARVMGLIDSGADDCIFPSALGRLLGLTVETGKKQPFMGAGALSNLAYFHRVKLSFTLDDTTFQSAAYVGFSTAMDIPKIGLLGRIGFFDRFQQVSFHPKEEFVELVTPVSKKRV